MVEGLRDLGGRQRHLRLAHRRRSRRAHRLQDHGPAVLVVRRRLAPGLLVAQAVGRIGNWFNHELFGLPTDLPWGLEIESSNPAFPQGLAEGTLFHPTFLYELIWNLLGAAVIILLERRINLRWGKAFAVYLIWYGVGRAFFESIRVDPSEMLFGVRTNVWAAWAAVVLGIVIYLVQRRRHLGLEPSVYVPGREWRATLR